MAAGWTSRTDQIHGWQMHTMLAIQPEAAPRPPVVLIHGLSVSHRYWLPLARHLSPLVDLYIPDLPGFGQSEKPPHNLSLGELTEILATWIRTVGITRPVLVGHSLSCQMITELACRYPDLAGRAVLIAPTFDPRTRSGLRLFLHTLRDIRYEPPSLLALLTKTYLQAGMRRTIGAIRMGMADLMEYRLSQVPIPVLVARARQDRIVTQPWSELVARSLPHGQLQVIPTGAHGVIYSQPRLTAEMILAFILPAAQKFNDKGD